MNISTAQRIKQHKRLVPYDAHPNFCFAKTSFTLETLVAIGGIDWEIERRKMRIEIRDIDNTIFADLFHPCKECIYWECPTKYGKASSEEGAKIKLEWFKKVGGVFDTCGKILYANGKPVAYSQFAPPRDIENIKEYEKSVSSASRNGVIITCLYVREGYRGRGFGQNLLKNIIEEVRKKGYKPVETYARDDSNNNPSGPTKFYLDRGFKIIESKKWENASFSLLRLNLEID